MDDRNVGPVRLAPAHEDGALLARGRAGTQGDQKRPRWFGHGDAGLEVELVRLVSALVVELPQPIRARGQFYRAKYPPRRIDERQEVRVVLDHREPIAHGRDARCRPNVRRPVLR